MLVFVDGFHAEIIAWHNKLADVKANVTGLKEKVLKDFKSFQSLAKWDFSLAIVNLSFASLLSPSSSSRSDLTV